jgi:23S rRNA pseudouridine1911/1915/1917 synthase
LWRSERRSRRATRGRAAGCIVISVTDEAERALGDLGILYEDNHLLAVDKPAGLLSQAAHAGDDCVLERAREYLRVRYDKPGRVFVGLVHRLDRNVSGVLLLARTSKAASRLSRAFAAREMDKHYLAIVTGEPPGEAVLVDRLGPRPEGRGVRRDPDGKEARLRYERLACAPGHGLLRVELLTGRKHQIRAQLALAGHPIFGDPLYGEASRSLRRPALHAHRLGLEHPVRRTSLVLRSPAPDVLLAAAVALGLGREFDQF